MKIRKGDQIKIIYGNDKGRQGKVMAVFPKSGRMLVEGLNIKKKHVRPKQQGRKGELVRIPVPFPSSRAMLLCPQCGQPDRAEYKIGDSGVKLRYCKKCKGVI